jgi:hypothetical protein
MSPTTIACASTWTAGAIMLPSTNPRTSTGSPELIIPHIRMPGPTTNTPCPNNRLCYGSTLPEYTGMSLSQFLSLVFYVKSIAKHRSSVFSSPTHVTDLEQSSHNLSTRIGPTSININNSTAALLGEILLVSGRCGAAEHYVGYHTRNSELMRAEGKLVLILLELLAGC